MPFLGSQLLVCQCIYLGLTLTKVVGFVVTVTVCIHVYTSSPASTDLVVSGTCISHSPRFCMDPCYVTHTQPAIYQLYASVKAYSGEKIGVKLSTPPQDELASLVNLDLISYTGAFWAAYQVVTL